jgi:hypothetical protein
MKTLYKLDLDPNEIYNVSLNIKQGNKTVDNLRFFQTKVPKLFNLKPSNYSTYSQIIEKPDAVVQTQSGGGLIGGGGVTLNVKSISWIEEKTGDFSEGELTSEPNQVTYHFTINLSGPPKMMGYEVAGFAGNLSFLNYRNDYKPSGNSLKLSLTLSQIDPTSERSISDVSEARYFTLTKKINKGDVIVQCSGLKGIIPGKTKLGGSVSTADSSTGTFENPTYVSGYTPGQNTFTTTRGARVAQDNGTSIAVTNTAKVKGFTGDIYKYLSDSDKSKGSTSPNVKDATFKYQTFPTYSAPSYSYRFGQNSFIKSALINPTVLESLIWENTVRDFIFFTIADNDVPSKKYFFGNYGTITPATRTAALTGTVLFNVSNPPPAPGEVIDSTDKLFSFSTREVQFYDSGAVDQTSSTAPPLKRPVTVRFAIARYTKQGPNWVGQWLGAKATGATEADVLSAPEALE